MISNQPVLIATLNKCEIKNSTRGFEITGKDVQFSFTLHDGSEYLKIFYLDNDGRSFGWKYIQPIVQQIAFVLSVQPYLLDIDFERLIGATFILTTVIQTASNGTQYENITGCVLVTDEVLSLMKIQEE